MKTNCRVYYRNFPKEIEVQEEKHLFQQRNARELLSFAFWDFFHIKLDPEQIFRTKDGKPYYQKDPSYFFNISHCDAGVAAAVANVRVGVDAESSRLVHYKTAKKCCSKQELQYICRASDFSDLCSGNLSPEEVHRFLRIWTLKESYLKMTGQGIRRDLAEICFRIQESPGEILVSGEGEDMMNSRFYIKEDAGLILSAALDARGEMPGNISWIFCPQQNIF